MQLAYLDLKNQCGTGSFRGTGHFVLSVPCLMELNGAILRAETTGNDGVPVRRAPNPLVAGADQDRRMAGLQRVPPGIDAPTTEGQNRGMTSHADRGRALFEQRVWADAFTELATADERSLLGASDLERLATAALLVGRLDESVAGWERAYLAHESGGDLRRAVMCAFWLAFVLLNHGDLARGGGWIHRAERLLDSVGIDCVEEGYVVYAAALRRVFQGDPAGAEAGFSNAASFGDRFGNRELAALARVGHGRCLIHTGDIPGGMTLLDEAMATVSPAVVSPGAMGDLYCTVIDGCQEAFDVRRAQEWTEALSRWCDDQPGLVLYRGQCLIHRAELMLLSGLWSQALLEVQRACDRLSRPRSEPVLGAAYYVRAELHRLRGEEPEAEAAYRQARIWGREPQPGLAELRLAQGHVAEAYAALRRGLQEAGADPVARARLLGPYVNVALVSGAIEAARSGADELSTIAGSWDSPYLGAVSAYATGSVLLAEGDPAQALTHLRRARAAWVELEVAYEAARTRILIGRACRDLGDSATADLELDAAHSELTRLGAAQDAAPVRSRVRGDGLSSRELEVLQQLATGKTNRAIASRLFVSEKTVATHVSSILRKLGVESRAAATAYAYQHHLL